MTHSLGVEQYLTTLAEASDRLVDSAAEAGPATAVPTCPGWSVLDVVIHLGGIQRWAAAHVERSHERFDGLAAEQQGRDHDDPLRWFAEGSAHLQQLLRAAPEDLLADFFLADAPPPRLAWARRQCHEATVHAIDVGSAVLGRVPRAEETPIRPELATDGVDELLTGFLPRPRTRLRQPERTVLEVVTTDTDAAWTVVLGPETPQTVREKSPDPPDSRLTGQAAEVYLGLWNRGEQMVQEGTPVLDRWRTEMQIH